MTFAEWPKTKNQPKKKLVTEESKRKMEKNEEAKESVTSAMEDSWNKETVPKVMKIVSSCIKLPQSSLISLLLVSPCVHNTLQSHSSLWLFLDFHEMNKAGDRLLAALSLPRYQNVEHIIFEFSQDIEDKHFELLRTKSGNSLGNLKFINLNGCQKISDRGVEDITSMCPKLKLFSIYWNLRVSDLSIKSLVKNCKLVTDLNFSGCKNLTDVSLETIAKNYPKLESLDITRCIKLTDCGLLQILLKCSSLRSLNLYALSGFTDEAYLKISHLTHLEFLDLCGAQNISDDGLSNIANCKKMTTLSLTWCVRATDVGVLAIAEGCPNLEFLSLFGIIGVTDRSLEALSRFCSKTLTTLDVNGCTGIKRRSREELLQLFPNLRVFKVHS